MVPESCPFGIAAALLCGAAGGVCARAAWRRGRTPGYRFAGAVLAVVGGVLVGVAAAELVRVALVLFGVAPGITGRPVMG